ncbi:hypothetical protein AGLY_008792 [Aphis glycines]|uniref:THAP-type domain-containing protein n=1 Tax=Aphis glycines TaxID=307491 RepID=A0A6G0TJJ7_APHGL|nr:hypothetical protein AGLY_008792 [Aphis glycines]
MWAILLRFSKEALLKKHILVCSKHFTSEDFLLPGNNNKRKRLKPIAIPSQNLPKSTLHVPNSDGDENCLDFVGPTMQEYSNEKDDVDTLECNVQDNITANKILRELKSVGTQVAIGNIKTSFLSFIDTIKRQHTLCLKECIVMVFVKFKQGLSFAILSILFNDFFAESCRLTYNSLIPQLACIFKSLIYWPSRQDILSNTPYCFEQFTDVRVVLDCTEISVQRPKCLTCRIKCYSNYKSTFTLIFLIGISPGGLITYISKLYGGRTSDKAIFEQSNLIELMQNPDAAMVDKGFLIDDICKKKKI